MGEYVDATLKLDAQHLKALADALRERDERIRKLEEAARAAYAHVSELREAWERGALSEHDGKGGTRSNRNENVLHLITHALGEG